MGWVWSMSSRWSGLVMVASTGACAPPYGRPTTLPEFESAVVEHIDDRLAAHHVPGAAVAWFGPDGAGFVHYAGEARPGALVSASTRYDLGEIGRLPTAIAALQGLGNDDLDLAVDDLPSLWRIPPGFPQRSGMTMRRILAGTAGLSGGRIPGWLPDQEALDYTEVLEAQLRLIDHPGTVFRETDGGFGVIQAWLEATSGLDHRAYVDQEIVGPLGLDWTTSDPSADDPDQAVASDRGVELPLRRSPIPGARGGTATLPAVAAFCGALLPGGTLGEVLSDELKAEITRPQDGIGNAGLGVNTRVFEGEAPHPFLKATTPGFEHLIWWYPEADLGVVVLTNGVGGDRLAGEIALAFSEVLP